LAFLEGVSLPLTPLRIPPSRDHRSDNISWPLVMPTLANEYLAHWFHHGGITRIVDFNFDDLQILATDDEVGPSNYMLCETPNSFHTHSRVVDQGGIKALPSHFLLKPHGTLRHPTSLIITHEQVEAFSEARAHLLHALLRASPFVVVMGFSFTEPDFRKVVAK